MPPVASEPKLAALAPLLPNPARSGPAPGGATEPFAAMLDDASAAAERPADKPQPRQTRRDNASGEARPSSRAAEKPPARDSRPTRSKDETAKTDQAATKSDAGKSDVANPEAAADAEAPDEAGAAEKAKQAGEAALAEELSNAEQSEPDAEVPVSTDAAPAKNSKPASAPAPVIANSNVTAIETSAPVGNGAPANQQANAAAPAAAIEAPETPGATVAKAETPDADSKQLPAAVPAPKAKDASPAKPVLATKNDAIAQPANADALDAEAVDGTKAGTEQPKEAEHTAKPRPQFDVPAHHNARRDMAAPAAAIGTDGAVAARTGAEQAQPIINTQAVNHAASAANAAAQAGPAVAAHQAAAVPVSGIAVEIAAKAFAGKNRFEIRLDPPELGRIDVRLDVDRHGHVTSRLVVERADTLDLLRRDAASLERALQDAGLKTSDNGLQFALRDQAMHGEDAGDSGSDSVELLANDESLPAPEPLLRSYRHIDPNGGIDIRV